MKIIDIIKISRPASWVIFPLAFYIGLTVSGVKLSTVAFFIMISLSFPFCLFGYGINDIYDFESDRKNPRKKSIINGHVVYPKYKNTIKKIAFISLSPLIVSVILTKNLLTIFLSLVFIILGYYYSAPPIRIKERPPFDSLSNGLIYGLLPFSLGFSLSGSFTGFSISYLWATLCIAAVHAVSSMMDFKVDKKIRVTTFAIKFGQRNTAIFAFIIFLLTFLLNQFSLIVQVYLMYCSIITFLLILFPTDRFARIIIKLIFVGFLVSAFLFILLK